MKPFQRTAVAAILLAAFVLSPAAYAQDGAKSQSAEAAIQPVLKAIPDNALGFVLLNKLGRTDGAISKLAAVIQVPAPSMLTLLKLQLGVSEGLDENGSAALALLPDEPAKSGKAAFTPIILMPVSDYKKFIAQFQPDDASAEITGVTVSGHPLVVGRKDAFAVFTLPEKKDRLAKAIAASKGVDSLMGSFVPWIARHQISLVATPSGSKMALDAAQKGLKMLRGSVSTMTDAGQVEQLRGVLNMYQDIFAALAQQVDAFAFGLRLDDKSNLSFDSHTTFVAWGSWATMLAKLKPGSGNRFAGLRAAPFIVAMDGEFPEEWSKAIASMSGGYFGEMYGAGTKLSPEKQKQFLEAFQSTMSGNRAAATVLEMPKPGTSIYDGVIAVTKVDDAKKSLQRAEQAYQQMIDITKSQKDAAVRFSDVKKVEVDGAEGLAMTMEPSGLIKMQKDNADAKQMSKLMGDGPLTAWDVMADEHTLVSAFGPEENAKRALEEFKNPEPEFASAPQVAAAIKLLPEHAQWIGLVDIKGYVGLIHQITGFPLPELPDMPPIGFAAEASGHGLDTTLVISAETLVKGSKALRSALSMRGMRHEKSHIGPIQN